MGGVWGGVTHSRAPFVATFLLQGGCPDRRMGPACNPQLFNTLPCTCRSQANEVSPNCKSPDHRIVSEVAARGAAARRALALSLAQPPPRCSRSASLNLLIAPTEPEPGDLRGACWLQSRVETAARTCLWAACGLPATARCLLLSASVSLPTATCLLGRCCSGYIPARVPCSPAALRAARRCWSCCVWRWAGVETWWVTVVRFEWSTGFEFLTVFQCHPPRFAAS